jgi:hypothetical protein
MVMIVHVDVYLGRPEDALHDLAPLEREAGKPKLGELGPQRLERATGVHKRAHDHVPGGTARTIEVGQAHGQRILLASLLIWLAWAAAP